jgi:hypothetical protein
MLCFRGKSGDRDMLIVAYILLKDRGAGKKMNQSGSLGRQVCLACELHVMH